MRRGRRRRQTAFDDGASRIGSQTRRDRELSHDNADAALSRVGVATTRPAMSTLRGEPLSFKTTVPQTVRQVVDTSKFHVHIFMLIETVT